MPSERGHQALDRRRFAIEWTTMDIDRQARIGEPRVRRRTKRTLKSPSSRSPVQARNTAPSASSAAVASAWARSAPPARPPQLRSPNAGMSRRRMQAENSGCSVREPFHRPALDFAAAASGDKVMQLRRAGDADAAGDVGARPCEFDQPAAVDQARRHHDVDAIADDQRQQSGRRRLDQAGHRIAGIPRVTCRQRLERHAQGSRRGDRVSLCVDDARGDQDAVRADAGFGGAQFGQRGHARRQQVADAIDFRTARDYRMGRPVPKRRRRAAIARPRRNDGWRRRRRAAGRPLAGRSAIAPPANRYATARPPDRETTLRYSRTFRL